MEVRNVLVGVAFIIILYIVYIYAFKKKRSSLISTQQVNDTITVKNLGNESNCAYSEWLYISEWRQGENFKHVFTRTSDILGVDKLMFGIEGSKLPNKNYSPTVYLGKTNNNLNILYQTESYNSSFEASIKNEHITISDFPIQAWTNLIISLNTKTLDIYINGKLIRSTVLNNPPNNPNSTLYLGKLPSNLGNTPVWVPNTGVTGGNSVDSYNGYISTFRYFSDPLSPSESWNIYNDGYDDSGVNSSLGKFKVKLSILDNNNEMNSIQL